MTGAEILAAIQTLGFPIVCAIGLAWFCYYMIKKIMEENREREERLYNSLAECREINKTAIETIALYAEKLDTIENSITEIKEDILVIKTRME